jgi:hypothetical protein
VPISRRAFLTWAAGAIPVAAIVRRAHAHAIAALSTERAPATTLHAVAEVVLPSELGNSALAREVDAFRRWMSEYREHAELTHGYGTSRIRYSGPTPATRWTSQLEALDAAARKQLGTPFAALSLDKRERLVRAALAGTKLDRMPAVTDADHVAVALLAHFYGSSEANDLCYGAAIGRETCRPLGQSSRKPLPLRADT